MFEGGGVKGIALVGAVVEAEARGYQWINLAGTSAGAIVAALLAAGYRGTDLAEIIVDVDYRRFRDRDLVGRLPVVGPLVNLIWRHGIHPGRYFENWLKQLLAAKGVRTFGDLVIRDNLAEPRFRYRLQVVATDLVRRRMVVLPRDAGYYGLNADRMEVAGAVRMSMSIPFFYRPVRLPLVGKGFKAVLVDGGVLSNFPVWLFDSADIPEWPTFGFKTVEPGTGKPRSIPNVLAMLSALMSTMLEAHDARHIAEHDFVRTIAVPGLGVNTVDFDLTRGQALALLEAGRQAAADFFSRWEFSSYIRRYRRPSGTL